MTVAWVDHESCTILFGHATANHFSMVYDDFSKIARFWYRVSKSDELLHNSSTKFNNEGVK